MFGWWGSALTMQWEHATCVINCEQSRLWKIYQCLPIGLDEIVLLEAEGEVLFLQKRKEIPLKANILILNHLYYKDKSQGRKWRFWIKGKKFASLEPGFHKKKKLTWKELKLVRPRPHGCRLEPDKEGLHRHPHRVVLWGHTDHTSTRLKAAGFPELWNIICRLWKLHLQMNQWVDIKTYLDTMEYYSAIKKNSFESLLMRWMKLEPIIQSEVSQKDKDHYSILTHIYGI